MLTHTDFIADLYRDYKPSKISASRAINSNTSKRGKVDEILVKNYDCFLLVRKDYKATSIRKLLLFPEGLSPQDA